MQKLGHGHDCFLEILALVGSGVCGIKAWTRFNGKLVSMPDEWREVVTTGRRPCLSAMIGEHIPPLYEGILPGPSLRGGLCDRHC